MISNKLDKILNLKNQIFLGNPLLNEALHGGNQYGQIPLAGGDFSLANKGILGIFNFLEVSVLE